MAVAGSVKKQVSAESRNIQAHVQVVGARKAKDFDENEEFKQKSVKKKWK